LVERNLAKVEVESSRLFSRSTNPGKAQGGLLDAFPFCLDLLRTQPTAGRPT
jgi:hypothetical protein